MPVWYAQYRILVWMCVLIAVNQLGFGSIVPVAPLYAASFGVSPAAIGLTIAAYGLARFLLAVPAGRSADRFGRRGTLTIGGTLTVLGNLACAVAPSYEWVLVAVLTWLRLPETRQLRPVGLTEYVVPKFGQQMRLLSGNRAFLLISLI